MTTATVFVWTLAICVGANTKDLAHDSVIEKKEVFDEEASAQNIDITSLPGICSADLPAATLSLIDLLHLRIGQNDAREYDQKEEDVFRYQKAALELLEAGEITRGLDISRIVVQRMDSQDPAFLSLLGVFLGMMRRTQLASQSFQRAAFISDLHCSDARCALHTSANAIEAILSKSQVDRSVFERQILQEHARGLEHAIAHNLLGRTLFRLKQWDEAAEHFSIATRTYRHVPEGFEWLGRAQDRAGGRVTESLASWRTALTLNPKLSDKHVWPIYCVGMSVAEASGTSHPVTDLIERERYFLRHLVASDPRMDSLSRYVEDLREMECSMDFIERRNAMINLATSPSSDDDDDDAEYSWTNFAYGQVFFPAFYNAFRDRAFLREALRATRELDMEAVFLGSNVGTEALFAAAGLDVSVTGYEIMCPFVNIAEAMRREHNITNAAFVCADALTADVGRAGVVFVDNQAWDESLTSRLWRKLAAELPVSSVVFEYTGADYYASLTSSPDGRWDLVHCVTLNVSWFPEKGTHAAVYRKRAAPLSGNYNDWFDYESQIATSWNVAGRLVSDIARRVDKLPSSLSSWVSDPVHGLVAELTGGSHHDTLSYMSRQYLTTPRIGNTILEVFHRNLFQWHCARYGLLAGRPLLREERAYLELYFRSAGVEHRNFQLLGNWTGNRMSSFSYSHRIRRDGGVDSSRFRFGTTSQSDAFLEAALPILRRRGIELPKKLFEAVRDNGNEQARFYGLGWDRGKRHFKVYLMIHDLEVLSDSLRELLHRPYHREDIDDAENAKRSNAVWESADVLPHALVSFTYDDVEVPSSSIESASTTPPELVEEKVYVYPRTLDAAVHLGADIPDNYFVASLAVMFSSLRGIVSQIDISTKWACVWRRKLSEPGRRIIDTYMDVGLHLETLAVKSKQEYTLYFPAGSG